MKKSQKGKDVPVRKNIGRLFRIHNIVEYKSPTDYLSIDDFYKVYGYACFYKSDTAITDGIPSDELTITLVCSGYPHKLMEHLIQERKYTIEQIESGIYYVSGDYIPIQIIVTSRLTETNNLCLKNLTNKLESAGSARKLIQEYGKHKDNKLYQSVMNMIIHANTKMFHMRCIWNQY